MNGEEERIRKTRREVGDGVKEGGGKKDVGKERNVRYGREGR